MAVVSVVHIKRLFLVIFVVSLCIMVDQITKMMASTYLIPSSPMYFFDRTIRLIYVENRGTFLSLGWQLPEAVRFWAFSVMAGVVVIGVLIYALVKPKLSSVSTVALSCLAGGGISNIIDRTLHDGVVIDFLSLRLPMIHTWIFNVADVTITLGIAMLVIQHIRSAKPNNTPAPHSAQDGR